MSSAREELEQSLDRIFEHVDVERVRKALDEVLESAKRGEELDMDDFLTKAGLGATSCKHPIVKKCLRGHWPNMKMEWRRTDVYEKLRCLLGKAKTHTLGPTDFRKVINLLEELRHTGIIGYYVARVGDIREGLRHMHAPGSVACSEARNLCYGEKYDREGLYKMARRLSDSISVGNAVAIYSEDEELTSMLKEFSASRLGERFAVDISILARVLGIRRLGGAFRDMLLKPHVILLAFLLSLREMLEVEQEPAMKDLLASVVERIRHASIIIFFAPRELPEWCTLSIPRLDPFFTLWLDDDERRRKLRNLVTGVINYADEGIRKASKGEKNKARNEVRLIMHHLELLCQRLLKFGDVDYYSAKNLVDMLIESASRYGIEVSFTPWKLFA